MFVRNIFANWANVFRYVQMLIGKFIVDAGVARLTMKIVLLATNFAYTTLIAMPLTLCRVIVIEKANIAEVKTECNLALFACSGRLLNECAVVAGNFFDFLGIERMSYPRLAIFAPILTDFFFDCFKLAYL